MHEKLDPIVFKDPVARAVAKAYEEATIEWLVQKRHDEELEAVKSDMGKTPRTTKTRNFGVRVYVYDELLKELKESVKSK